MTNGNYNMASLPGSSPFRSEIPVRGEFESTDNLGSSSDGRDNSVGGNNRDNKSDPSSGGNHHGTYIRGLYSAFMIRLIFVGVFIFITPSIEDLEVLGSAAGPLGIIAFLLRILCCCHKRNPVIQGVAIRQCIQRMRQLLGFETNLHRDPLVPNEHGSRGMRRIMPPQAYNTPICYDHSESSPEP